MVLFYGIIAKLLSSSCFLYFFDKLWGRRFEYDNKENMATHGIQDKGEAGVPGIRLYMKMVHL